MNARNFGPELPSEICDWLEAGPVLPSHLKVLVAKDDSRSETREFEILERDSDSRVHSFKSGKRRGRKGYVLKVRDPVTRDELAAKLCLAADYEDGHPLFELETSSKLKGGEDFVHLIKLVGRVDHLPSEPPVQDQRAWVCFLSDWLPGRTLHDYIEDEPESLDASLVAKTIERLIVAVQFFEARGLKHDDLHLGNIMLVPSDADIVMIDPLTPPFRLKIIDLGSTKPLERSTKKADDDWSSVAKCIAILHNTLHANRRIASRHPQFLKKLAEFTAYLSEEDQSRYFPQKTDHLRAIREASQTLTYHPVPQKQFRPFDAISAEHLANDRLLLDLFVSQLPWITMVADPEPSVLVGPRGCGKSMVFRFLAAKTHIASPATDIAALDNLQFFGIYVGCSSDIANDLIWLSRETGRPKRMASEIVTYFNLVLARELLRSLSLCAGAPSIAAAMQLTDEVRSKIVSFISAAALGRLSVIRVGGIDPLLSCSELLDQWRMKFARKLLHGEAFDFLLGAEFVRELCRTIVELVPWFSQRRLTFLLDDYTSHRLSSPVQEVLNSVLWQRDHSHTFKVSSEPHGFNAIHVDGPKIDDNREYVLTDAGEMTLGGDKESKRREFVTELLDKRLSSADYKSDSQTLIGPSAHKDDPELAKAICGTKGKRTGAKTHYHGLHVLSNAWSGDVSTVLHMAREMFAAAGVSETTTTRITPAIQHQSIVKVSVALRERVGGHHPYGSEMAKILSAFGDLAHRLLIESPSSDPSGKFPIHRKYRLELSLKAGATIESELRELQNGEHLVSLMRELVRRAVFVELPPSRGKESPGRRTLRWQLRASLLPSFGTSLIRESYIDVKRVEDFAELLLKPEIFTEKVYRRYTSGGGLFEDIFTVREDE